MGVSDGDTGGSQPNCGEAKNIDYTYSRIEGNYTEPASGRACAPPFAASERGRCLPRSLRCSPRWMLLALCSHGHHPEQALLQGLQVCAARLDICSHPYPPTAASSTSPLSPVASFSSPSVHMNICAGNAVESVIQMAWVASSLGSLASTSIPSSARVQIGRAHV